MRWRQQSSTCSARWITSSRGGWPWPPCPCRHPCRCGRHRRPWPRSHGHRRHLYGHRRHRRSVCHLALPSGSRRPSRSKSEAGSCSRSSSRGTPQWSRWGRCLPASWVGRRPWRGTNRAEPLPRPSTSTAAWALVDDGGHQRRHNRPQAPHPIRLRRSASPTGPTSTARGLASASSAVGTHPQVAVEGPPPQFAAGIRAVLAAARLLSRTTFEGPPPRSVVARRWPPRGRWRGRPPKGRLLCAPWRAPSSYSVQPASMGILPSSLSLFLCPTGTGGHLAVHLSSSATVPQRQPPRGRLREVAAHQASVANCLPRRLAQSSARLVAGTVTGWLPTVLSVRIRSRLRWANLCRLRGPVGCDCCSLRLSPTSRCKSIYASPSATVEARQRLQQSRQT
jgi:hypothetical protein